MKFPENSGDVPDMVKGLRGFEDKGARSDKDLKGGFIIRKVANNSQYPYLVERDGDETQTLWYALAQFRVRLYETCGHANRMDRRDLTKDSCGEVRFIYRLSYKSKKSSSSLHFLWTLFISIPNNNPVRPLQKLGIWIGYLLQN